MNRGYIDMTNNQKITLSILVNILSFGITIVISLFITPLIVNSLGGDAYGFIGLANNFVSYATLVTIALNSMAGRFVSLEIYRQDYEMANRYFTSVFFSNLIIALVMAPFLAVIVLRLEYLIDIPASLIGDVKTTFAVTFISFLFSIIVARYEIATFVTNRIYLSQRNNLIGSALRLLLILICFRFFSVRITYVVLATFCAQMFSSAMNIIYTKRFLPELKISLKDFDLGCIKTLISSGSWNLIGKLSGILLDGLDLLITNLFIGPIEMGALALSKTIPAMFVSLRGTLDYPFTPPMTECYAKGDIDGVIRNARAGNKVLCILMIAPMAVFSIYGQSFFQLWVPGEDGRMIQILSLLSILSLLGGACINSVFSIYSITNKLKLPSLVVLLIGILTLITNYILLNITSWGVYIIAAVSSFYSLLRNLLFTPLYGAHCLGVKKTTFYHEILTGNLCLVLNLAVGFLIHRSIPGNTWFTLILGAGIMGLISIAINFFIVLSASERINLMVAVKHRLYRNRV